MEDTPQPPAIPEHAKHVFEGVLFDVYQWEQELYDGSTAIFEKLRRRSGTAVIPVLSENTMLITEDEQPGRPMVITFPGGQLDEGETPEAGTLRELKEETGYEADELILWKAHRPFSKMDWTIYTYIARGCRKVTEPDPGPGERIVPREITLDELIALADNPLFQNVDISLDLMKARYDSEERKSLAKRIFG